MDELMQMFLQQAATLYRSRPYTKAIPFQCVFPGTADLESFDLWTPSNAFFELCVVTIRADVAGLDLTLNDTNAGNPIMFVMPPTAEYQTIDINPGYRSLIPSTPRLQLQSANLTAATVKGTLYGFEVTPDGYYR